MLDWERSYHHFSPVDFNNFPFPLPACLTSYDMITSVESGFHIVRYDAFQVRIDCSNRVVDPPLVFINVDLSLQVGEKAMSFERII